MSDTQTDECAAMGATTADHERFNTFVGTFNAEVKMWMGPGEPHISTGTMTNSLDLGGRYLKQHYVGNPEDAAFPNFEGRGYWGFNTFTGRYEGFWVDTASTFMQTETGVVDESGKSWEMIGEVPSPQGGAMTKRSTVILEDDDHHTMEMFFRGPDGNEFKAMEIRYTRA